MITQLENMQIAMDVVDFLSKHDRWHDCTIMVGNVNPVRFGSVCTAKCVILCGVFDVVL